MQIQVEKIIQLSVNSEEITKMDIRKRSEIIDFYGSVTRYNDRAASWENSCKFFNIFIASITSKGEFHRNSLSHPQPTITKLGSDS